MRPPGLGTSHFHNVPSPTPRCEQTVRLSVYQVDVKAAGKIRIDVVEKPQELLMPMPSVATDVLLCRLLRKQVCFCTPVLTAFITSCQDAIAKGNSDQSTWTGAGPNKRALRGIDTGLGGQHLRHHSFWRRYFSPGDE